MFRGLAEKMAEISAENDIEDAVPNLRMAGLLDSDAGQFEDADAILVAIREDKNNKLFDTSATAP